MSVTWRAPEKNRPNFPALVLRFTPCPFVLNEPPYPAASRWNPPAGVRVAPLTIAAVFFPYSAAPPPVSETIWVPPPGAHSPLRVAGIPQRAGRPSTQ